MKKILLSLLMMVAVVFLSTSMANALVIYQLDAAGNQTVYDPGLANWIVQPDSSVSQFGSNFEVKMANSWFATPDVSGQPAAIYGGGVKLAAAYGYKIDFTAQLYTWDSYDLAGSTGTADGYWDVFAVNLNQTNYYWNVATGDPIVSPDPAGGVVIDSSILPGITWAYGGYDYVSGGFESFIGAGSITLIGTSTDYYLSLVLDTSLSPNSDTNHPSYGAFNPNGTVPRPEGGEDQNPVPEPSTILLLGAGLVGLFFARKKLS